MSASFDPYHKWLGIPPAEQPPHHYRLIGVSAFESDPDVIDAACDQRMAFLHQCAAGPHSALSQQLLNELAAARVCLLDAERKQVYDVALREMLSRRTSEDATPREQAGTPLGSERNQDPSSEELAPEFDPAAGAAVRPVGRRWRWSWPAWVGVHGLLLYFGWTYLVSPRLGRHRRAAAVAQAQPAAKRATQPRPETETSQVAPDRARPDASHARALGDALQELSATVGERGSPTTGETKEPDAEPGALAGSDLPGTQAGQPASVRLPDAVALPSSDDPTPATLGTIALVGERNVELLLDSEGAVVGNEQSIHLERGAGAARWTACLVSGSDEPQHIALADFTIHRHSLRFQWHASADEAADQLRNCVLHLSLGPEQRTMALRTAVARPAVKLDMTKESDRHVLDLPALPRQRFLFLEVLEMRNFPAQAEFRDAQRIAQLGKKDLIISLDARFDAEIEIGFDRYRRKGIALGISPSFRLEGRRTELTTERLENLRKQVNTLPSCQQRLNALRDRESALDGELRRLGSLRTNDGFQRALLVTEMSRVRSKLDATYRDIESLERRIEQLEQIQRGLPGLEELLRGLHLTAELRFRVFARTGSAELDLVRAE